ncbi:hypothetical protein LRM48_001740 [Candidatus Nanosynbacter sp. TM7-008]|uniref:hypothetical protein n=1 Tax=Candidatus Nanosynbacter sp. TM7-008 TaxID=2902632 RepID=UPI001FB75885|nr:hypothetical protein [Candidatus Nanosynbacter sp. TM7-008]MCJ1964272.1 hypothetical protein [Candidatus Nanosynbacter sp. TM7-008]
MKLIDARTGECRGNILILDNPAESPSRRLLTIHVDQENWEMLEAITNFRKELVKAFRDAYGYESQRLLDVLNSVDECIITIASYGRTDRQLSKDNERVSTRNLSAVADRLSNMIVGDLSLLAVHTEAERVKKEHCISIAPLYFFAYVNAVWHYALNSTSYALRVQDFRNTLLVMADSLRPDAS